MRKKEKFLFLRILQRFRNQHCQFHRMKYQLSQHPLCMQLVMLTSLHHSELCPHQYLVANLQLLSKRMTCHLKCTQYRNLQMQYLDLLLMMSEMRYCKTLGNQQIMDQQCTQHNQQLLQHQLQCSTLTSVVYFFSTSTKC